MSKSPKSTSSKTITNNHDAKSSNPNHQLLDTEHKLVAQIIKHCTVPSKNLKKRTEPSSLPDTTEGIHAPSLAFGQDRAIKAMDTALDIKAKGYNIFAVGENGLGKRTFIINYLRHISKSQTVLADWIYVHNFTNPQFPLAIKLPRGNATTLIKSITNLWRTLTHNLQELKTEPSVLPNEIPAHEVAISKSTNTVQDSFITTDDFKNYHKVACKTVNPVIDQLLNTYKSHTTLCTYLNHLREDMIQQAIAMAYVSVSSVSSINKPTNRLINQYDSTEGFDGYSLISNHLPNRYFINLVNPAMDCTEKVVTEFSNSENGVQSSQDIPIVYEDAPSVDRLLGYLGHTQHIGSTVTDVSMIRAGALHRANGGYLLLNANYLLHHQSAWWALKHALKTQQIKLPSPEQLPHAADLGLTPQPIPLNLKVILLGDTEVYDDFVDLDISLIDLFKVRADFHDEITRTQENERALVATMASLIKKHQLPHFASTAQAAILEDLSLQAEDQNKLSLHIGRLTQLMLESNRHGVNTASSYVTAVHVKQALSDIEYRSSYLQELYLQELTDGQQLISTAGMAVGQINALTIIEYADGEFGMPARLTAVVQHSQGSGDILDVERDVELGGSLHAKGMLIMNSYLRALFSPYHALNFTASLAFEQSYAQIDGDSATLAEACALLSALADIPISQSLAITGSMNQLGMVQAVGGINAKVAGFFDTCHHQGLTGEQGVILPFTNINQLMLRDDIIRAVSAGDFHIYAVKTLSEALTILTKMPVDTTTKKGRYRKSSLFGKVIKNLKKWDDNL